MTFAPTFKGGVEIGQKHYNLSIVIITTGGPTVQFRLLLLFLLGSLKSEKESIMLLKNKSIQLSVTFKTVNIPNTI